MPNCNCWNIESQMYFTDFCKSQRMNANNITPYECRQDMEAMQSIPPSTIPTGVPDPVIESAKGGRGGFDFGGLLGGLSQGLSGAFGGSSQQQQPQVNVQLGGGVVTDATPSRGWIPFAVIGGVAVVGVVAYIAIKNPQ